MKNEDNPSTIKILKLVFQKNYMIHLIKNRNEPKQKLDNKDTAIDEKLKN